MRSRFEVRTTIDGFPLTLNFRDEDELADFCEQAPDCECEIVKVVRLNKREMRPGELTRIIDEEEQGGTWTVL